MTQKGNVMKKPMKFKTLLFGNLMIIVMAILVWLLLPTTDAIYEIVKSIMQGILIISLIVLNTAYVASRMP